MYVFKQAAIAEEVEGLRERREGRRKEGEMERGEKERGDKKEGGRGDYIH